VRKVAERVDLPPVARRIQPAAQERLALRIIKQSMLEHCPPSSILNGILPGNREISIASFAA